MYCPNCGKEIEENARFCMHCGAEQTPVSVEEEAPVAADIPEAAEIPVAAEAPEADNSPFIGTAVGDGTYTASDADSPVSIPLPETYEKEENNAPLAAIPVIQQDDPGSGSAASNAKANATDGNSATDANKGKYPYPGQPASLLKLAVLSVITLNIYTIYWYYKTSQFVNQDESLPKWKPGLQTVLCVCIPLYIVYWYYRVGQKVSNLSAPSGHSSDLSIVAPLLSIVGFGWLANILLQDDILHICSDTDTTTATCSNCAETFDNDQKACPNCGTAYKKPFKKSIWCAILAEGILLVLLSIGVYAVTLSAMLMNPGTYTYYSEYDTDYDYEDYYEDYFESQGEDINAFSDEYEFYFDEGALDAGEEI